MKEFGFPLVMFRLSDRLFGLDSSCVNEMLVLPPLAHLPATQDYIRGVMNLRGTVIMVVDLRKMMNMSTVEQDLAKLIELLGKREQDHINWLTELDNSIKEHREFKLTTNPHACAFGKWYDTYKATNVIMENHLRKFDAPHKRIHALGMEAVTLVKNSKVEEATALIEREKNVTLALLVNLFAEAKKLMRETVREIVIVLTHQGRSIGVSVDSIESVEHLKEDTVDEIPGISAQISNGLVTKTGKTLKGEKIVMLINTEEIFQDSGMAVDLAAIEPVK